MEENPDESWKDWFDRFGPKLLLCARQWTSSYAEAEDVVQDAFVRYWRSQRSLPGDPLALLLTSVRRAALDRIRSGTRRAVREEQAAEEPVLFERTGESDDRKAEIERAMQSLPEDQRQVLTLKLWAGLTFAQIGEQLGISANTAASRYRYALSSLRQRLTPELCHD